MHSEQPGICPFATLRVHQPVSDRKDAFADYDGHSFDRCLSVEAVLNMREQCPVVFLVGAAYRVSQAAILADRGGR